MLSLQRLAGGARPFGVRAFSTAPTFDWQTDNSNVAIRGKVGSFSDTTSKHNLAAHSCMHHD